MIGGDKRGQFFLLAAVIIITGIVAIASIKSFVTETGGESEERIYDLGQEVGYESARVIDYGIYNDKYNEELIDGWLANFTEYVSEREGVSEWLFVYGNKEKIVVVNFTSEDKGNVGINVGDKKIISRTKPVLVPEKKSYTTPGSKVRVRDTLGIEREFELAEGESFYFVVAKKESSGTIIEKND
jgi:hypothetical protein